ncbi:uncharacterized protein EI90DRAFT_2508250 [Cantharellus anzutake]|uniref:uncharacterized protein n=1 Tax=Cantharellus anzutake TaxID=1750568 RepID=UPI0019034AFC|nr:uncharacterized protein EI90DRAFT_2508250 [Cantharellus anzutake]KAF8321404.1 hypothetical protein EI90DRAFT_2508250 [Cantharellus anzutake]
MFTPHTLKDFQLPDPTWMWVSRCWLVQMGGNGGSHDGFQYNWCFRQKGWRPYPGKFNSGGWVRRRRWIRLMMRPADPEFIPISTNKFLSNARPVSSWTGDVGKDIVHCRRILRQLGTDGRKIATWRRWLKVDERQSKAFGKTKRKASEEDDEVYPTVAFPSGSSGYEDPEDDVPQEWEWAVAVIRCFTKDILFTFIYPESRARFIRMLQGLDLDSRELQHYLEIDFWVLAHLQL